MGKGDFLEAEHDPQDSGQTSAFLKNDLASYLFVKSQLVFFDMEQPLILFFAEYIAMMGLWACVTYYSLKAVRLWQAKKK